MVETLGGTQTRWAHANDENINVAAIVLSVLCSSLRVVEAGQEAGGGVRKDNHIRVSHCESCIETLSVS